MHSYYLPLLGLAFVLHWFVVPPRFRLQLLAVLGVAWSALCCGPMSILLVGLVVLIHLCCRLMASPRHRPWLLPACLLLLIGNLLLFKSLSNIFPTEQFRFIPVGLSYVTFRLIHVLVDVYFGRLSVVPLTRLTAYTLFFPTFVAGPVDRYQRFEVNEGCLEPGNLNRGLLRLAVGIAKKALAADRLRLLFYPLVQTLSLAAPLRALGISYGLLLVLYLDFSAYSDIAVASGLVLGMKVMENFDYPLLKPSLPQFWRAWHISVYNFIRDYFLFPLFASRASEAKLYLGLVLSFVVFMLWHRISWVFLILGLYLGLPVAATAAFARVKARRPRLRKVLRLRALQPVMVALTVTYIAVGVLILHWDGYLTGVAR